MAGSSGQQNDRLTSYREELLGRPWAHDFYQVMRRIESLNPSLPRLGEARRPAEEPIRLGQPPDLAFAPAAISHVEVESGGRLRILVNFLGLWGPHGPMPLHLTEFARERQRNYGDVALVRFADIFHHRALLLFYRAWRQAQPVAGRDSPSGDRYGTYVGALFGQGAPAWQRRTEIADDSKRYFAGHLHRSARNAEGLADILSMYFGTRVGIEQFTARWMQLPQAQRFALGFGGEAMALGIGAVIGARVLDAQYHCCITLGPMPIAGYERMLPEGAWHGRLREWICEYVSEELDVLAILEVERAEVPGIALGRTGRLGWTSWLGHWRRDAPASGARMMLSRPAA